MGLSVPDLRAEGEKLRWASVGGPSQRFSQLAELQALDLPPTNTEIAELLAREASEASYVLQRAYRRAARSALLWEVEACDLVAQKRPLTELTAVMKLVNDAEKELSGKGRVLLRYSGTEPKIRLLIEGRELDMIDKQADRIAEAIQSAIGVQ